VAFLKRKTDVPAVASRRRETEDRRQKTEDRRQKTEDRRQKTEDRRQKTEDKHYHIGTFSNCHICIFFNISPTFLSIGSVKVSVLISIILIHRNDCFPSTSSSKSKGLFEILNFGGSISSAR
jgi:hypothetical protein